MKLPFRSSKKIKFHLTVVAGVLLIVGAMAVSTVSMILSVARRSAYATAENQFALISNAAIERTVSLFRPAMDLVTVSAFVQGIETAVSEDGLSHPARLMFSRMLVGQPAYYSAYVGYGDGSFFQVIHAARNPLITRPHDAPSDTEIIVRTITGTGENSRQRWTFLDLGGAVLHSRVEDDFDYDPRQRPWYLSALGRDHAVISNPYVFNSLKQPGITASHLVPGGSAVVGVDLTISSLTSFVSSLTISPHGGVELVTDDLATIAKSAGIEQLLGEAAVGGATKQELINAQNTTLRSGILFHTVFWNVAEERRLAILTAAPVSDFMSGAVEMRRKILLLSAAVLLITVPFVVFWALRLSRALKELTADAEKVGGMIFDGELNMKTPIYEFHQLALGFGVMKSTIADRTRALQDTLLKLEMLVDMTIAMSAEFDINRLSEMILSGAKKLTNADGGSLYLANETRDKLDFQIVLNDTLGFVQGGTSGSPVTMRPVPLYDSTGKENHRNVVTHIFHREQTENIADAYQVGAYDFSGTREFDEENDYRSISFLTVPLKPRGGGDVLGALQLINARDEKTGEIIPFPESFQGFVEALSSAAAVAVQNWKLMERQKRLFDDLVRFVASAIDAKSPYTARHCSRVPEIARLLATEAQKVTTGPLADFKFDTVSQQREFEVGAWLHDCGKVTTPEYVVDKATKLETIYNRIHEIRTRFEVVLRDARIERHLAVISGTNPVDADQALDRKERQLHQDFAFVAECNVGTEYMEDAAIERLMRIARYKWEREFDNKIGLSWAETKQLSTLAEDKERDIVPAKEDLIADRPEHIIERDNWTQSRYDTLGFKFSVPDSLYNRGELYNLMVRTGTLTEEERFKIDEHVAQTIVMLEHIPFPDDLKRVPEYAGNHHEAPDGSGYPRNLTESELSIPTRIMAIADIFEALTSTDRPYKRDKTLSETIEILYEMKEKGQIDPDLFNLLISSGVYREYAEKFLEPGQVDTVDVARFLSDA